MWKRKRVRKYGRRRTKKRCAMTNMLHIKMN